MPATLPRESTVTPDHLRGFHADGFTAIPELVPRDEALAGRQAALALAARPGDAPRLCDDALFLQILNAWRGDAVLRGLTFHPHLLAAVRALAGRPMRLWHDQLFIKRPEGSVATAFHQDLPYWPVPRDAFTVSAWLALGDIGEDDGCLSFLPRTHGLRGEASDTRRDEVLLGLYPDLAFAERVTVPLRAGGCTFHQGYTAHRAGANRGAADRVALSVIFIAADTRVSAQEHALTHAFGLRAGEEFPDEGCPRI